MRVARQICIPLGGGLATPFAQYTFWTGTSFGIPSTSRETMDRSLAAVSRALGRIETAIAPASGSEFIYKKREKR